MCLLQLEEEILKTLPKRFPSPTSSSSRRETPAQLLPAAEIVSHSKGPYEPPEEIQRPGSALHSGNFTEGGNGQRAQPLSFEQASNRGPVIHPREDSAISPTAVWPGSNSDWRRSDEISVRGNERYPDWANRRPVRSRAPSLQSFSSSYVLKAPTTPLVQQSNSEDFDLSNISPVDLSSGSDKSNRRHTLPPNTSVLTSDSASSLFQSSQPVGARRNASLPHQAHRSRRSLTSALSLHTVSSPRSPASPRPRRPSHSSELGTSRHASMVGSYEESILRGWMSTAPSQPLDFTAQIGVLGKNGCKPKCPAHVTISFPAVFYSYGNCTGRHQSILDEPSPYVGQIDLSQLAPPVEADVSRHKRRRSPAFPQDDQGHISSGLENDNQDNDSQSRKRKKRRKSSTILMPPPAGSYRIPEQGQLQIIIKNPNKTAVKLFLVPYDLTGMEAGTKTFLRQRCYSSGPSIDYALSSTSQGAIPVTVGPDARQKPTLRYLIHVNICCPSRGRFYLYQNLRVVFANRVPDNKESLRKEIQVPEPRFSTYKPHTESLTPTSDIRAKPTAERSYRRRSSGFGYGQENVDLRSTQSLGGSSDYPYMAKSPPPPVPAIPFNLTMSKINPHADSHYGLDGAFDGDTTRPTTAATDMQSPLSDKASRLNRAFSGSFESNSSNSSEGYTKLSKGDNGLFGRPSTPEPGEGLLARRLKSLGLERGERVEDDV